MGDDCIRTENIFLKTKKKSAKMANNIFLNITDILALVCDERIRCRTDIRENPQKFTVKHYANWKRGGVPFCGV